MLCPHACPEQLFPDNGRVERWAFVPRAWFGLNAHRGGWEVVRGEWPCVSCVWLPHPPQTPFLQVARGDLSCWLRTQLLTPRSSQSPTASQRVPPSPEPQQRGEPEVRQTMAQATLPVSAPLGWFWELGTQKAQGNPRPLGVACGEQRVEQRAVEGGAGRPDPVVLSAERQPGGTPPMPWFPGTLVRGASGQQRMGFPRAPAHARRNSSLSKR